MPEHSPHVIETRRRNDAYERTGVIKFVLFYTIPPPCQNRSITLRYTPRDLWSWSDRYFTGIEQEAIVDYSSTHNIIVFPIRSSTAVNHCDCHKLQQKLEPEMASKMSRNRFNSFHIAGFLYLEMLMRSNINVLHPISGQNSFVTNKFLFGWKISELSLCTAFRCHTWIQIARKQISSQSLPPPLPAV
jgi:hypothetical protein